MSYLPLRALRKLFAGRKAMKAQLVGKRRVVRRRRARKVKGTAVYTKKFVLFQDKITCGPGLYVAGRDTFELNDCPDVAKYVALYENYRIDKISYKFRALCPVNLISNGTTAVTAGMIHTKVDYNDNILPGASAAGIQNMMMDNNYRGNKSTRDLTRTFKPKYLTSAGTSGEVVQKSGWINTSAPNVSHYGIKWILEGGWYNGTIPLAPNVIYEPVITYYVSFKDPQ